jgi:hypothetical protein
MQEYVIGTRNVPWWCKNRIMPFRKSNGVTGFEFFDKFSGGTTLKKGDLLVRDDNGRIIVKRKR